jgi:hypothetical protein
MSNEAALAQAALGWAKARVADGNSYQKVCEAMSEAIIHLIPEGTDGRGAILELCHTYIARKAASIT